MAKGTAECLAELPDDALAGDARIPFADADAVKGVRRDRALLLHPPRDRPSATLPFSLSMPTIT